jgi:hypothetical protein
MNVVRWTRSSLNELAGLWLSASQEMRARISDAVAESDNSLARSPDSIGESRTGNNRVAFFGPLGIEYEFRPDDRLTLVARVWLRPQKRRRH